jgi:hypothetical protein
MLGSKKEATEAKPIRGGDTSGRFSRGQEDCARCRSLSGEYQANVGAKTSGRALISPALLRMGAEGSCCSDDEQGCQHK